MRKTIWRNSALLPLLCSSGLAQGPQPWTWEKVVQRFEASNPNLLAGKLNIDESKANEITAYLRPNPGLTLAGDQIDPFNAGPDHGPFAYFLPLASFSYLHEREHKRELRLESAQKATDIATSTQADLERTLLFNLRNAFVQILQAKAVYGVARENLAYYDKVLNVSSEQFKAGDISQIDLDRLELQRVQYESDLQNAIVSLRTSKIQLLTLLSERTPVDQFDVFGLFDFTEQLPPLDDVRKLALDTRPDLKAAMEAVEKAKADHKLAIADGSTDPTFGLDVGRNPPIDLYFGVSVNIPLRIFDRNQGEKRRTELDVDRNQRLLEASQLQVFSDVDSAYTAVDGTLALLRPYRAKYLQQAVRVRDTITFAYQHGGASLLEFLNAENDYRSVELSYVNLIGSYLTAAGQLNLSVGREVIP
jgi:cobalt-zinc-cadmium efflux system outer membrane protein